MVIRSNSIICPRCVISTPKPTPGPCINNVNCTTNFCTASRVIQQIMQVNRKKCRQMSSKDTFWEDLDTQKVISPFLKKSRHQAYHWELEQLSPLPPEAEFFFLKHEKRRGLIRKSGNGGLFYSTPSGSPGKPNGLCYNHLTSTGSGHDLELQHPGGGLSVNPEMVDYCIRPLQGRPEN